MPDPFDPVFSQRAVATISAVANAFDGENANIGFVTVADIPYPELVEAAKDVTSTMYQNRYGK